jgi:hypothetical protein
MISRAFDAFNAAFYEFDGRDTSEIDHLALEEGLEELKVSLESEYIGSSRRAKEALGRAYCALADFAEIAKEVCTSGCTKAAWLAATSRSSSTTKTAGGPSREPT